MVWFKFSQQLIKALGMIEVHCVAELMEQNVAHQLRPQEEEIAVQADVALSGAAAPKALLAPYPGLPVREVGLFTQIL